MKLDGKSWLRRSVRRFRIRLVAMTRILIGGLMSSMGDYMKFLREHLRGLKGQSSLMRQEIFGFLHTSMVPKVACGWGVNTNSLSGLEVHGHSGSGGTFYMTAGLFPERDFAIAVAVNAGTDDAGTVCGDARKALTASLYWDWLNRSSVEPVTEPDGLNAAN